MAVIVGLRVGVGLGLVASGVTVWVRVKAGVTITALVIDGVWVTVGLTLVVVAEISWVTLIVVLPVIVP